MLLFSNYATFFKFCSSKPRLNGPKTHFSNQLRRLNFPFSIDCRERSLALAGCERAERAVSLRLYPLMPFCDLVYETSWDRHGFAIGLSGLRTPEFQAPIFELSKQQIPHRTMSAYNWDLEINTMMQTKTNENAAGIRRICKRSDQPIIERLENNDARLILRSKLNGRERQPWTSVSTLLGLVSTI